MMGVTFADHFVSFLASKGHIVRDAVKVARNPDQSKHLETAMVTVLGLDVDLVNLRSEVYADDSRIPSEVVRVVLYLCELQPQRANPDRLKGFGTPLEDALRRDITINSLFYNVHTHSVEDHTRKVILVWFIPHEFGKVIHL
jgi:tRNA nucleotidyltransferase (CCA-adding enzyme)